MSERDRILARVRAALGEGADGAGLAGAEAGGRNEAAGVQGRRGGDTPRQDTLALFVERCRAYGASVYEVSRDGIAAAVAEAMKGRGSASLVVPPGLPEEWSGGAPGVEVDTGLGGRELDGVDAALTGSILGIAETGTFVLSADDRCGRRAISLIPDHHICVVDSETVVHGVAEAFAELEPLSAEATALTFVSGPSATADIELKRVQGVHGPRKLDIILVRDMDGTK